MSTSNFIFNPEQHWKNSPFGENSIFHPNFDAVRQQRTDDYLLQISIDNAPKDFKDTLFFSINTNLPVNDKVTLHIFAIESIFNTAPDINIDIQLYKQEYIINRSNKVSIAFTEAMDKLASKDLHFSTCYIKVASPKIKDTFSQVFNVNRLINENIFDRLSTLMPPLATWQKLKRDADRTPVRKFTDQEIIDLAATVIGESGQGSFVLDDQMAIAWVYYNRLSSTRWIDKTLDACLTNFSYAYKQHATKKPTQDVMVVMTALGNDKYANENSGYGPLTVRQLINTINQGTKPVQDYIAKGKILKQEIIKQFATPWRNTCPGYTNQGYWVDLCKYVIYRSDDIELKKRLRMKLDFELGKLSDKIKFEDTLWVLPLLYYYFQESKKVSSDYDNTFVRKLRNASAPTLTTFIFKFEEINSFFIQNPDLTPLTYKDIPIYFFDQDKMDYINK